MIQVLDKEELGSRLDWEFAHKKKKHFTLGMRPTPRAPLALVGLSLVVSMVLGVAQAGNTTLTGGLALSWSRRGTNITFTASYPGLAW